MNGLVISRRPAVENHTLSTRRPQLPEPRGLQARARREVARRVPRKILSASRPRRPTASSEQGLLRHDAYMNSSPRWSSTPTREVYPRIDHRPGDRDQVSTSATRVSLGRAALMSTPSPPTSPAGQGRDVPPTAGRLHGRPAGTAADCGSRTGVARRGGDEPVTERLLPCEL